MTSVAIDAVLLGDRHRNDLGDIRALADSLTEVGLLHPIVVTTDLRLVAGHRRLVAARSLGWTEIDVTVVSNLTDAASLLRAESDENSCRKDFTPTEAESIASAREALLRPLAEDRMKAGKPGAKLAQGQPGKVRGAAAVGTGYSHETIRKVREVKQTAAAPETPEPVREVAKQALAEMDATGRVDGSYQRVKDAERAAAAHAPSSALGEFVESSQAVQDAGYARNFVRALAKAHDFLGFDADRLGPLLDDTELDVLDRHVAAVTRFAKAVHKARSGLRVVKGTAQ